jgi:hypothetical protein
MPFVFHPLQLSMTEVSLTFVIQVHEVFSWSVELDRLGIYWFRFQWTASFPQHEEDAKHDQHDQHKPAYNSYTGYCSS